MVFQLGLRKNNKTTPVQKRFGIHHLTKQLLGTFTKNTTEVTDIEDYQYPYTLDIDEAMSDPIFHALCPDEKTLSALGPGAKTTVVASNGYLEQVFLIQKKVVGSYRGEGGILLPKYAYSVTVNEPDVETLGI